jgi:hypothetical protein
LELVGRARGVLGVMRQQASLKNAGLATIHAGKILITKYPNTPVFREAVVPLPFLEAVFFGVVLLWLLPLVRVSRLGPEEEEEKRKSSRPMRFVDTTSVSVCVVYDYY